MDIKIILRYKKLLDKKLSEHKIKLAYPSKIISIQQFSKDNSKNDDLKFKSKTSKKKEILSLYSKLKQ